MMASQEKRQIVIEFEKVQIIRKRARTNYSFCRNCGVEKDFVGLSAAADLFGITADELCSFVTSNNVHVAAVNEYNNSICVTSLLEVMQAKQNGNALKLIGD